MLWLETAGDRPVLAFGSEGNTHTVVVDFGQGLWDLSDEDLQRFLDEAKFRSAELRGIVAELGLPRPASAEEPGVETLPRTAAKPGPLMPDMQTDFVVRDASPDDAEAIARIYVDSWNAGFGHLMGKKEFKLAEPLLPSWA